MSLLSHATPHANDKMTTSLHVEGDHSPPWTVTLAARKLEAKYKRKSIGRDNDLMIIDDAHGSKSVEKVTMSMKPLPTAMMKTYAHLQEVREQRERSKRAEEDRAKLPEDERAKVDEELMRLRMEEATCSVLQRMLNGTKNEMALNKSSEGSKAIKRMKLGYCNAFKPLEMAKLLAELPNAEGDWMTYLARIEARHKLSLIHI